MLLDAPELAEGARVALATRDRDGGVAAIAVAGFAPLALWVEDDSSTKTIGYGGQDVKLTSSITTLELHGGTVNFISEGAPVGSIVLATIIENPCAIEIDGGSLGSIDGGGFGVFLRLTAEAGDAWRLAFRTA
jgi:hypothetical protein